MTDEPNNTKKARLSATKHALLDALLQASVPNQSAQAGLVESPTESGSEPFPLTEVQQAYWLGRHKVFELGVAPSSYVEFEVVDLDLPRLESALARLIAHHAMLRAIVQPDGQQRILAATPKFEVPVHDLRGRPDADSQLDAIRRRLVRGIERTDRWPLFSIEVSQHETTHLHVMFDILLVDVQSVRLLTRDLTRLYRDPTCGLVPIERSFRDLVLEREARKATPAYAAARDYWLARLDTLPPPPALPFARPPSEVVERSFIRHTDSIPAARWSAIKQRITAAQLAPTAALLTAFGQTLARRSASARFTLNLTLYNRPPQIAGIDEVVGDFTSLTLVELDLSSNTTFAARATQIQRRIWEALENREFDGVEVLRERTRRLRVRSAPMPVVFTSNLLHDRGDVLSRGEDPLGRVVMAITQTPQVWIDHQVAEHNGDLVYNWDVLAGLFPDGLVEEMLTEYRARIDALATDEEWQRSEALATTCTAVPPRVVAHDERGSAADAFAAPVSDHVLARVLARAGEILGVERVDADARLVDLGVTSIGFVRLANALEVDLDVRPELDSLFVRTTPRDVAALYDELIRADPEEVAVDDPRDFQLILDPGAREAFVRAEHGIRRDLFGDVTALAAPSQVSLDLEQRRTHRTFAVKPVPLDALGSLLAVFRRSGSRYSYPSAGGLYPVQVYVHAKQGRVAGLSGNHYYDPSRHRLTRISDGTSMQRRVHGWNNRSVFDQSAFSLFLVVDERAMQPLYGRLTRELALVEVGAMLELAMLAAPSLGLGLCPIGRVEAVKLRGDFAWDPAHAVLHTLLGGALAPTPSGDAERDLEREVRDLTQAEVELLLAHEKARE